MTFRNQLSVDAAIFVETDEYGETVEFFANGVPAGGGINVSAAVFREPTDTAPSDRNVAYQNRCEIFVSRTNVVTVNPVKAQFKFPAVEGVGVAVVWQVYEIVDKDDPAMWHLVLGR